MDSTVCMRKNHYETLGLRPTANDQEIRESFAQAMRLPHRPAELSQIGIAFDRLRNHAKRRAYDEALGLRPEQTPRVSPSVISLRMSANFGGLGSASLAQPKPTVASPVPEQPIKRIPEPQDRSKKPTCDHLASREVQVPEFLTGGSTPKRYAPVRKQSVVDWKYPAFALGSLILGAALMGAWAGAQAEDTTQDPQGPATTVALPPAKSPDARDAPVTSSPSTEPEFISPAVIERARQRIRTKASVDRRAGSGALETPVSGAADVVGSQPRALATSLPLPDAVIARTIERIGYACGGVASATPVEVDDPGTYKVTCTSGQSYQARPVYGRYHFRRW